MYRNISSQMFSSEGLSPVTRNPFELVSLFTICIIFFCSRTASSCTCKALVCKEVLTLAQYLVDIMYEMPFGHLNIQRNTVGLKKENHNNM